MSADLLCCLPCNINIGFLTNDLKETDDYVTLASTILFWTHAMCCVLVFGSVRIQISICVLSFSFFQSRLLVS